MIIKDEPERGGGSCTLPCAHSMLWTMNGSTPGEAWLFFDSLVRSSAVSEERRVLASSSVSWWRSHFFHWRMSSLPTETTMKKLSR